QWDALEPGTQKEVLENQWTVRYFLQLQSAPSSQREQILGELSEAQRRKLDQQLAAWSALPADKRQQMCDRFQQFFELPQKEKKRTLDALSEVERREMEKTLEAFEKLPPEQRRLCVSSFGRFTGRKLEEGGQFLKNAERWKEMTAAEREIWRNLVVKLPPLPPGFGQPPLPPGLQRFGSQTPPSPRQSLIVSNASH